MSLKTTTPPFEEAVTDFGNPWWYDSLK